MGLFILNRFSIVGCWLMVFCVNDKKSELCNIESLK